MKKKIPEQKIGHPYQVPDHFFETFQGEIMESITKENQSQRPKMGKLVLKWCRYAATLLLLFLAGKGAWSYLEKPAAASAEQVVLEQEIETIYSQISEEDLIDFIAEDMDEDFINQLDF